MDNNTIKKEKLTFETSGYLAPEEEKQITDFKKIVKSKEEMQRRQSEGHWIRGSVDEFFK